jgi:hypothetical protein
MSEEIDKKIINTENQLKSLKKEKARLENKEKLFLVMWNTFNPDETHSDFPKVYKMQMSYSAFCFDDEDDAIKFMESVKIEVGHKGQDHRIVSFYKPRKN